MPQLEESPDAVVFTEGRAPGLEERLRRNHEDFHEPAVAMWPELLTGKGFCG